MLGGMFYYNIYSAQITPNYNEAKHSIVINKKVI